ncbi:autotransporter strand-loop-strand O-heptosyltransferase, partial [Pantoea ananatis]|nr:autotransporter strand-loop-strand O-heptosyltransferase [Pantoea ananatis]
MSETVSANDLSTSDSDLTEPSAYPFVLPPEQPSMTGPCGIRYDFNDGARVLLPEGRWRVALLDDDSGNVLFRCETGAGWVTSAKKYFVRFRIQVWRG